MRYVYITAAIKSCMLQETYIMLSKILHDITEIVHIKCNTKFSQFLTDMSCFHFNSNCR